MPFTLGAVAAICFFLPGLAFLKGLFLHSRFSRSVENVSATTQLASATVISVFTHFCLLLAIAVSDYLYTYCNLNLGVLTKPISEIIEKQDEYCYGPFRYALFVLIYLCVSAVIGWFLGYMAGVSVAEDYFGLRSLAEYPWVYDLTAKYADDGGAWLAFQRRTLRPLLLPFPKLVRALQSWHKKSRRKERFGQDLGSGDVQQRNGGNGVSSAGKAGLTENPDRASAMNSVKKARRKRPYSRLVLWAAIRLLGLGADKHRKLSRQALPYLTTTVLCIPGNVDDENSLLLYSGRLHAFGLNQSGSFTYLLLEEWVGRRFGKGRPFAPGVHLVRATSTQRSHARKPNMLHISGDRIVNVAIGDTRLVHTMSDLDEIDKMGRETFLRLSDTEDRESPDAGVGD